MQLIASLKRLSLRLNYLALIARRVAVSLTPTYSKVCYIGIKSSIGKMYYKPKTKYTSILLVALFIIV